jgi:DNA-binding transcriptional regulator GbsR (MarR family)
MGQVLAKLIVPVKGQIVVTEPEAIRQAFAADWARVGGAWGVTPSTAAVQGYFLVHGGPLTETEIREALGMSHRAAFAALAECEAWGLIEAAPPQRSGRRGPAGRAWVVVGDPWEWFRRVAASRLDRETAPVEPLVASALADARAAGDADLVARLAALGEFASAFDRGAAALVSADAQALGHLMGLLARLEPATVAKLLSSLSEVPGEELAAAAGSVARMRPSVLRRLLRLAAQPGVARVLERLG